MAFEIRTSPMTVDVLERLLRALPEAEQHVVEDWREHLAARIEPVIFITAEDDGNLIGAASLNSPAAPQAPHHVHCVASRKNDAVLMALVERCQAALAPDVAIEWWVTEPLIAAAGRVAQALHWNVGRRIEFLRLAPVVLAAQPAQTRPFRLDMANAVAAINNAAFHDHADRSAFTAETVLQELDEQGNQFDDLRLLGGGLGFVWTKRHLAIGEIYVLALAPEAQGRQLAAPLLAAGVDHLQNKYGVDEVNLYVDADNTRAIRLYERNGFVMTDRPLQSFTLTR